MSHFGFGGSTASNHCKKIPDVVLQKFRNCGGIVPKYMSYEEMYETPLVEHAALHRDLVEESLAQRSTEVEGSQALLPQMGHQTRIRIR